MNKKILIFIDWYKPSYKAGGPIRSISNLVSQLHKEYDFYIVTRNTDYLETTPYTSINSDEWNKVDEAQVYYFSLSNCNYKRVENLIKEVNPFLIYCNNLYALKYTIFPIRIAKKLNIKTILAARGMLSKGSLAIKSTKKKLFLSFIKSTGLYSSTVFHATTSSEKANIEKVFGKKIKTIIAQNLPDTQEIEFYAKPKIENRVKAIYVGRIAPEKNTLFAIEALSRCKKNIELAIYGPIYNAEYFKLCKKAINQLPPNIVVTYNGILDHNLLNKTLKNHHILYLPSTGENFGHSIIEGMKNSCIPVISDQTPWKNLEQQNVGYDLNLNDKESFAQAFDSLAAMDEIAINTIGKNAYDYATQLINNNKSKEDYDNLFNSSIEYLI